MLSCYPWINAYIWLEIVLLLLLSSFLHLCEKDIAMYLCRSWHLLSCSLYLFVGFPVDVVMISKSHQACPNFSSFLLPSLESKNSVSCPSSNTSSSRSSCFSSKWNKQCWLHIKISDQSISQAMSAAMLLSNAGEVSGLTTSRLKLTPTILVLISPMKVSTDSAGTKQLHSISCSLFNHNVPQMNVLCSILNNFLENPYNLPNLPSCSIDNDKLFGGLARKSVSYPNRMLFV